MNNVLSKVIDLFNSKNYIKAELTLEQMLSSNPNSFDLNKLLAISLLAQKKYNSALIAFNKCYNKKKDDYEVCNNISYLFNKVQDYKNAIRFAEEAITLNSDKPFAYQNLAECYLFIMKFSKAKEYAQKSIDIRGGLDSNQIMEFEDLVMLYADILLANNDIAEFKILVKKLIDKKIFMPEIFKKFLRNDITDIKPEYMDLVEEFIAKTKENKVLIQRNNYLAAAHFILAEYYLKKDKNKSEKFFETANQFIADIQRQSLHERQNKFLRIINCFKNFDDTDIKKNIDPKKGEGLIFIIGMPRSGTTLTESILKTANDIKAGGEKVYFTVQLSNIISDLENKNLNVSFFEQLGDGYLNIIDIQRDQNFFFIDKLPENYFNYKFIKLALPGSKFIHTFRNPWDNAISLFKEHFAREVYYASSFFGIAMEYANYKNIINFWKNIDGEDCMLDIQYEDLVTNTHEVSSKMMSFCGLSGEYSEEKRKNHFAQTASKQQVTRDIFQTSLKKNDFRGHKDQFEKDLANQNDYLSRKMSKIL